MSLRAAIAETTGFIPTYWFARLVDARESGDALMADAARRQLLELGFDVQPRQARRPRRKSAAARSRS